MAALARPSLAVVLGVGESHLSRHGSLENIAREKALLVAALPPGGVAVLNADDPRVAAMAARCRGRVVTFGRDAASDFRATEIRAAWPERLSFTVTHGDESRRVRTRFVGEQYVPSVLAAVAAAHCLGLDLKTAADGVATVEPHRARTEPVELLNGAVILRDEYGGNWLHLRAGLEVLRTARASRRVAVLGMVSECGQRYQACARQVGREAAACADAALFVGRGHRYGAKGAVAGGLPPEAVHAFAHPRDAAEFLGSFLRAGDVVYLSGRVREHLTRIAFAQRGEVACWKTDCDLPILCDFCPELGFRPAP
jgi:UDP-N-acetylmuramoyl-tripeptide--D-alanyl-D-alanine ligase